MVKLLGSDVLQMIKVFITDGDSQEITQLDQAIAVHCKGAIRTRCNWHVVDQGTAKNGPKPSKKVARSTEWKETRSNIKEWMYAWMNPNRRGICETEEEFLVSKSLFLHYIDEGCEHPWWKEECRETMQEFYRRHIEPHEDHCVFYPRAGVRHLNASMNTAHEGTNNGMKHCANPVGPQLTLNNAAVTLSIQGKRSCMLSERTNARQLLSNPVWSNIPCSAEVTALCLSLITTEMNLAANYQCVRTDLSHFRIAKENYAPTGNNPIPVFVRVRIVTIENGFFKCSCRLFERCGYGCRHIILVIMTIDPSWKGFTKSDVDVFWWQVNQEYGCRSGAFGQALSRLRRSDLPGPLVPMQCLETYPISTQVPALFRIVPAAERLLNYTKEQVESAMSQYGISAVHEQTCDHLVMDSDNILDFSEESTNAVVGNREIHASMPEAPEEMDLLVNPYQRLTPLLKELASTMNDSVPLREIAHLEETMRTMIANNKKAFASGKKRPIGKKVSSAQPMNKRKTTHGTAHYQNQESRIHSG